MAEPLLREATGAVATYEGTLRFLAVMVGSHSAHVGPVLETSRGGVRLYVEEDNPFENGSLRAYVGMRVRVEGTWKNGVLRVSHMVAEAAPRDPPALGIDGAIEDPARMVAEPTPDNHAVAEDEP